MSISPCLKQSPPVRGSGGEKPGLNRREILAAVCLVYTFLARSMSLIEHPPHTHFHLHLLRDAVPFCFLPHLCLSVWLMVWNIECCLFLLWLGRQGALWQTTRDQIDYAAFLWSRPFFNVVIVSGLHCRPVRGKSPLVLM